MPGVRRVEHAGRRGRAGCEGLSRPPSLSSRRCRSRRSTRRNGSRGRPASASSTVCSAEGSSLARSRSSAASRASASPRCCCRRRPRSRAAVRGASTCRERSRPRRCRAAPTRVDALVDGLWFSAESDVKGIVALIDSVDPDFVVVDSVQTMHDSELGTTPGTVNQVRGCAQQLIEATKRRQTATVLVGHVTKENEIAGPRVLEHAVDTVLSFGGDRHHALRLLRALKHRFGSTDELGLFEMGEQGLIGVPDPERAVPRGSAAGCRRFDRRAHRRRQPSAARRGAGAGGVRGPRRSPPLGSGRRPRPAGVLGRRARAASRGAASRASTSTCRWSVACG